MEGMKGERKAGKKEGSQEGRKEGRKEGMKAGSNYPVFKINCNQQKMYCAKTIHICSFGFVLSSSKLPAVFSCKISAPIVK